MIALIQKVTHASVSAKGYITQSIKEGYLIFLGVTQADTDQDAKKLAAKVLKLRLFADKDGKLNLPITTLKGEILVISQFTLLADPKKGNRPSFHLAAPKDKAEHLYHHFTKELTLSGLTVKTGFFQQLMKVKLLNDGPVTIWLDSEKI